MSGLLAITNGSAVTAVEVVEGREEAGALVEGSGLPCGQLSASGGHRRGPCHTPDARGKSDRRHLCPLPGARHGA